MATIYYLGRDVDTSDGRLRAETLRTRLHTESLEEIPREDFTELYGPVADVDIPDLDYLYEHWSDASPDPIDEFVDRDVRPFKVGDLVCRDDGTSSILLVDDWQEIDIV